MPARALDALDPHLGHLANLPFVDELEVEEGPIGPDAAPDLWVEVKRGKRSWRFAGLVVSSHLTLALVEVTLARLPPGARPLLLVPYVGAPLADHLEAQQVNYVDALGNLRLDLGGEHVAVIRGKRGPKVEMGRSLRAPGYRLIFALLARPDLLNLGVRDLGEAAGVSKGAASQLLRRLLEEGVIAGTKGKRRIVEGVQALEKWRVGYADVLRPSLLRGRYQTPHATPAELEKSVERALKGQKDWGFGGGLAARRLGLPYAGACTVLHLEGALTEVLQALQAVPDREGGLVILGRPGPLALLDSPARTAHPLLAYAELLTENHTQAGETAKALEARLLRRRS